MGIDGFSRLLGHLGLIWAGELGRAFWFWFQRVRHNPRGNPRHPLSNVLTEFILP